MAKNLSNIILMFINFIILCIFCPIYDMSFLAFRVNQLDAHSDHCYYMDYADMEKSENPLMQSLNGQWEFAFSKNVMDRPENFYEENFDASLFDKIMVPGHIELAGYDKIRYINTMYMRNGQCGRLQVPRAEHAEHEVLHPPRRTAGTDRSRPQPLCQRQRLVCEERAICKQCQ